MFWFCRLCGCGFCAYCLQDCGRDAHAHVAGCTLNKKPNRDVFGTPKDFQLAQKERRTRLLKAYLRQADLNATVVLPQLIKSLQKDLNDLEIQLTASDL
jgi:hypothetical protein